MSQVFLFLILLFGHWIADFVLQSHWMATNKATSNLALAYHVAVYSIVMTLFFFVVTTNWFVVFIYLFVTHFAVDYHSSRLTKYYMNKRDIHTFFVIIGLDQFIHFVTIALGMYL